ncbi:MAG: metal-binding protein [Candidatus Binatia bacterium]
MNECEEIYLNWFLGTIGGHRRRNLRGRMACLRGLRWGAKGQEVKFCMFFANEMDIQATGSGPRTVCILTAYRQ